MSVRVRFAPSPTGHLHIGGARTALFNWLFARNKGGIFILRIEDTDTLRNKEEFTDAIMRDLKWLGLDWDEGPQKGGNYGPYFQSERMDTYKTAIEALQRKGLIYNCYCTPEELDESRKNAMAQHRAPGYDGKCRDLTSVQKEELVKEGRKSVLRFRVPDSGETRFKDLIRGEVSFENKLLNDFVIQKTDGMPTFLFANAVDDAQMDVTHVIRGDDHISNTPRQLLILRAISGKDPVYVHVPLIFGKSGSPLSKRDGAVSLDWYKEGGFLPDALMNYLALLGWAPDGVRQVLSREEMTGEFNVERVSKNPAIFDIDKLTWINSEHMKKLDMDTKVGMVASYLEKKGFTGGLGEDKKEWLGQIVEIIGDRLRLVCDIETYGAFFFSDELNYDQTELSNKLKDERVKKGLSILKEKFSNGSFDHQAVEEAVRATAQELGLKAKDIIHPLRYVLTAKTVGPSLFETVALIGRERVIQRLSKVL